MKDLEGHLATKDGHSIHYRWRGNPMGKTILFVHGGPGLGTSTNDEAFFDLSKFNVVFYDQRGCGKSTPLGELSNNRTSHLVRDITLLLDHLSISSVILFGGSWGSALSLIYAIQHTDRVKGLIIRGVFTATKNERTFLEQGGVAKSHPDIWERFSSHVPEDVQDKSAYYWEKILKGNEEEQKKYSYELMRYGTALSKAQISEDETHQSVISSDYITRATLLSHYSVNDFFVEEGYILQHIKEISNLNIQIVQGKSDMITPPAAAIRIASQLPNCQLHMVDAGHSSFEPQIIKALKLAISLFS